MVYILQSGTHQPAIIITKIALIRDMAHSYMLFVTNFCLEEINILLVKYENKCTAFMDSHSARLVVLDWQC
jgi:hypothetical protein